MVVVNARREECDHQTRHSFQKNLVYKYLKNNENASFKLITEQQQGK